MLNQAHQKMIRAVYPLPSPAIKALISLGIQSMDQLMQLSLKDWEAIPGVPPWEPEYLRDWLAERGYDLPDTSSQEIQGLLIKKGIGIPKQRQPVPLIWVWAYEASRNFREDRDYKEMKDSLARQAAPTRGVCNGSHPSAGRQQIIPGKRTAKSPGTNGTNGRAPKSKYPTPASPPTPTPKLGDPFELPERFDHLVQMLRQLDIETWAELVELLEEGDIKLLGTKPRLMAQDEQAIRRLCAGHGFLEPDHS